MKRKVSALAALAVMGLLVLPAVRAVAQPGPGRGGQRLGAEGMIARLDLTEGQQVAATELREEGQAERRAWREELIRLRHDLRGEMLKDAPSAARIDKLSAEIGSLQASIRSSRLKQRVAFRALLSPAQRDKLPLPGMARERPGRALGRGRDGGRGHGCCERRMSDGCRGPCQAGGRGPGGPGRGESLPGDD